MPFTYNIAVDSTYLRTTMQRYYRQRPFYIRPTGQFAIFGVILVIGWVFASGWESVALNALGAALVATLIGYFSVRIINVGVLARLKGKTEFGSHITITMSEEGLSAVGPHVQTKWEWGAYPRSVVFSDGILLLRRGVIRWLPNSSLENAKPEDVVELVRTKTASSDVA
jgi:hypothetical protein